MVPSIKNININNNIKKENISDVPKEYREVAEGMESEFVNFLISEMRKTVNKEEEDSTAQDFYESMLDNEYSQILSKTRGGVGLQKIILDQIYPQLQNQKKIEQFKEMQRNNLAGEPQAKDKK